MSTTDNKESPEQKQTWNEDTMQDKPPVQTLFHKTAETMDIEMQDQVPEKDQSKPTESPQNEENKRNQAPSTNIDKLQQSLMEKQRKLKKHPQQIAKQWPPHNTKPHIKKKRQQWQRRQPQGPITTRTTTQDPASEQSKGVGQDAIGQDKDQQPAKQIEEKSDTMHMTLPTINKSISPQEMPAQNKKKEKSDKLSQEQESPRGTQDTMEVNEQKEEEETPKENQNNDNPTQKIATEMTTPQDNEVPQETTKKQELTITML